MQQAVLKRIQDLDKRIAMKPYNPSIGERLLLRHRLELVLIATQTRHEPAQEIKNRDLHRLAGLTLLSFLALPRDHALIPQACLELTALNLEMVGLTASGVLEPEELSGADFR